jgi:hypothetical protein
MAGPSLFCYEGMRHQTIVGLTRTQAKSQAAALFFAKLFVLLFCWLVGEEETGDGRRAG